MPMINIEDAYILDETGAQVDQVTGLYFKNENASDTEKAQARANIGAGGSNDNLLDNWYFVGGGSQLGDGKFPINQRGQTTYSNSSYGIDRWVGNYTLNAGCLTVNGFMYQIASYPLGVPLTFSAMLEDGSVVGGTLTITETTTQEYFYTDGSTIQLVKASGGGALMVWTGSSVNVKAVKLEVGTVSTLANDAPPDFGSELRKCQRYFTRLQTGIQHSIFGAGVVEAGNIVACAFELPTVMRVSGTASAVVNNLYGYDGSNTYTVSGVYAFRQSGATPIASVWCGVTATAGTWLQIRGNDGSAYIDMSAEL